MSVVRKTGAAHAAMGVADWLSVRQSVRFSCQLNPDTTTMSRDGFLTDCCCFTHSQTVAEINKAVVFKTGAGERLWSRDLV